MKSGRGGKGNINDTNANAFGTNQDGRHMTSAKGKDEPDEMRGDDE